ncbi:MAG: MraY family glycosyltransferase [Sideroxydans sp.]|nr:MraY family glycosyltransferase [Sideroxydans sp.]
MVVFLSTLLLCVLLVLALKKASSKIGLIDHPGGRKQHSSPTPTIGGVAMFVAVALAIYFSETYSAQTSLVLLCAGVLVALGVLDDKHDLRVGVRMMAQVFIALVVIMGADGTITHLGSLFGVGDIQLGLLSVAFTVVAYVGGINAMNMIDGADGMAGKMALISTAGVAFIFSLSGASELLPLTWAMLGALLGFLLFNTRVFVKRAWVFMGDAGSMWIGLVLGWFMAQVAGAKVLGEPALVLWLFGIPLLDTLVVMFRRVKKKNSPFYADRTHIHHVLEAAGVSVKRMVLVLGLVQISFVMIGVIFYMTQAPAWLVFWSFILVLVAYYYRFKDC